jgi:4-carboxymuconolactone decarboxylase
MSKKPEKTLFETGLEIRNEVLGAEYAKQRAANMTDFVRPMQKLAVEFCWGTIWTRPGLPRKTRSLINLAMMTALNRPQELKVHVRGALNNGCTIEEITEVFLQASVYCGVPAGVDSFRIANEVLQEEAATKK